MRKFHALLLSALLVAGSHAVANPAIKTVTVTAADGKETTQDIPATAKTRLAAEKVSAQPGAGITIAEGNATFTIEDGGKTIVLKGEKITVRTK